MILSQERGVLQKRFVNFNLLVIRFSFVFQVAPCEDGAVVWVEEHVLEGLPSCPVPADLGHGVKNIKDGIKYKRCILQLWKISP